jgi:FkbM family methyltransferase
MTMVSYAQNGEDVVLHRLFKRQLYGRYIDIGAADPVVDSVTKHFYDRGWRGINVEPSPQFSDRLAQLRPEDVNLHVAVSDHLGSGVLHDAGDRQGGLSTLDDQIAERVLGHNRTDVDVVLTTLAVLVEEHDNGTVDFLKIDVEGSEREVIAGADWERCRPRVVVVEAVQPNEGTPTHQTWEHLLIGVGYRLALFDGLNRFYALDEEACELLSVPANVTDDFVRADLVRTTLELRASREANAELRRRCADLEQLVELLEQATRAIVGGRSPILEAAWSERSALTSAPIGSDHPLRAPLSPT